MSLRNFTNCWTGVSDALSGTTAASQVEAGASGPPSAAKARAAVSQVPMLGRANCVALTPEMPRALFFTVGEGQQGREADDTLESVESVLCIPLAAGDGHASAQVMRYRAGQSCGSNVD